VEIRMSLVRVLGFTLLVTGAATAPHCEERMLFTANQNWLSRIYVMDLEGSVIDFFQYDFYRFVDMEVVDDRLYVAEAFAPRVYEVDPATGNLEVLIDDWSLYYFYGLAFDGTYFYVDEWDLNRYDIGGVKDGTASFDEDVMGMAWDGAHLWTLNDTNQIRCWDISSWPQVTELPQHAFAPPTPACRGLWFDGEYLFTAESGESIGSIFRFDFEGQVVEEWPEPAFSGWAACLLSSGSSVAPEPNSDAPSALRLESVRLQVGQSAAAIRFVIPAAAQVTLDAYDSQGARAARLLTGRLEAGWHSVSWYLGDHPSGIYWLRLTAGNQLATDRLLHIR
jgi:hypothetical protein